MSNFGIEKICVNEHEEISRFLIWQCVGDRRQYYSTSLGWGHRRNADYFRTEGLARREWNRVNAGHGYNYTIREVDLGELECEGK